MILAEVSERNDLKPSEIKGPGRVPSLVRARDEVVYTARLNGYRFSMIGRFLNRDHSTMTAAYNRHVRRLRSP